MNNQKIAIFASGNGSNAHNILTYFRHNPNITFPLIVTNKREAGIYQRAEAHGIPIYYFPNEAFREGDSIAALMDAFEISGIVLAGFLTLIPPQIIKRFGNNIINIHPSLLPKYGGKGMYGTHVHRAVKEAGEVESGITIHTVSEQYDEGTYLLQAKCPILPTDSLEDIEQRIHALEYRYFPEVIAAHFLH